MAARRRGNPQRTAHAIERNAEIVCSNAVTETSSPMSRIGVYVGGVIESTDKLTRRADRTIASALPTSNVRTLTARRTKIRRDKKLVSATT